ncbi:hypothetical protein [Microbacterium sp. SA39]|uniref:hypothetical protein n=1 Tax=Microbacterium sp. SA39 TaxID=1263625 RepID=UPI0005FA163E|nr:hypothetical protein [Microbacterium sp. SA39]KJQ55607.1 hypothetical protein RS85_00470 [Microbacterium sp. SA39]
MSEPDIGPVPSLIQQRIAFARRRSFALYTLISSTVIAIAWFLILIIDGNDFLRWLGALVFAFSAIYGIIEFRRVRRDILAFEKQHGAGAGAQKPVR